MTALVAMLVGVLALWFLLFRPKREGCKKSKWDGRPLVILALLAIPAATKAADRIPPQAEQYRRILHAEVLRAYGLAGPQDATAIAAGTIHQESAWNPRAASAYAQGLTQFVPSTFADMVKADPSIAALGDIWNPHAAIRAMTQYHVRLWRSNTQGRTDEDRWSFTLSDYNGGKGNTNKDRALCRLTAGCDPSRWFGHVELHSGRAPQFFSENRRYVSNIWLRFRPLYARF